MTFMGFHAIYCDRHQSSEILHSSVDVDLYYMLALTHSQRWQLIQELPICWSYHSEFMLRLHAFANGVKPLPSVIENPKPMFTVYYLEDAIELRLGRDEDRRGQIYCSSLLYESALKIAQILANQHRLPLRIYASDQPLQSLPQS